MKKKSKEFPLLDAVILYKTYRRSDRTVFREIIFARLFFSPRVSGVAERFGDAVRGVADGAGFPRQHRLPEQAGTSVQ